MRTQYNHDKRVAKRIDRILKCVDNQRLEVARLTAIDHHRCGIPESKRIDMENQKDEKYNTCQCHASRAEPLLAGSAFGAVDVVFFRPDLTPVPPDGESYIGMKNKGDQKADPGNPEERTEVMKKQGVTVHLIRLSKDGQVPYKMKNDKEEQKNSGDTSQDLASNLRS